MELMTKLSYQYKYKVKIFNLNEFKRKMIAALIERPLKKREINAMMNNAYPEEKPNTNLKRADRLIKDLIAFSLLHYDEESEKHVWKIKTKNKIDTLVHSRQLIPALKNLAGINEGRYTATSKETTYISPQNMKFLMICARDHLLSYPDISLLLQKYSERNRAIKGMKDKFIARSNMNLREFFARERPSLGMFTDVGTIPEMIYEKLLYRRSEILDMVSGTAKSLASFIEKETSEINNLTEIKRIRDIQTDTAETKRELKDKIRVLIFGIKAGRTLSGGCMICAATDNAL